MIQIAFSSAYHHPLPEGHRFPMDKYTLIPQQLLYEGTFEEHHFFAPQPFDNGAIEAVHDAEYVAKLKSGTLTYKEIRRIGFPYSPDLVTREEHICAGTTQGAEKALESGIAFNVAGGTHHAYADHGEGFCMYNDIAVAAQYLLDTGAIKQALVVDLDVHQGNGTASIFASDSRVFTFSMHCQKNYPLRKEKSDLDIPLDWYTEDATYLQTLETYLPPIINKVKPDIIFYQSGVDILFNDKLGKLSVSVEGVKERDYRVLSLAQKHEIPLIASMGGGYSERMRDIVEAHCNTFRVAAQLF
ncbi:MAG: histone deacetylase family protein [Bacteroidota bacterium]